MPQTSTNVTWHSTKVTKSMREDRNGHRGAVIWLTGLSGAGTIVITAFISPYQRDRLRVRALLADGDFIEVFVKCDLEVCEQHDPKGLYKKARSGEIPNFTGISAPYEELENAEIIVDTGEMFVMKSVDYVVDKLHEFRIIDKNIEHALNLNKSGNGDLKKRVYPE